MGKITVLIADDHAIVRIGLRSVFGYESDIEVVAEAKNGIMAPSRVSFKPRRVMVI